MREFINLYRYTGQDEGIPQLNIDYDKYSSTYCLFAFDLSSDGTLGGETGTLNLLKRGSIRLEIRFSATLTNQIKLIVLGSFDNVITVDKERTVTLDY